MTAWTQGRVLATGLGSARNGLAVSRPYVYRGKNKLTPADMMRTQQAKDRWKQGDDISHGTGRGYQQHRKLGEQPCDACRQAHNAITSASSKRVRAMRKAATR